MSKVKIEAICNARQQQKNGQFETYQALLAAAKGLGDWWFFGRYH